MRQSSSSFTARMVSILRFSIHVISVFLLILFFSSTPLSGKNINKGELITHTVFANGMIQVIPTVTDTASQDSVIKGTVTSQKTGNPLPGVTVQVKGAKGGAATDKFGAYSIPVTNSAKILIFRSVGFKKKKIKIKSRSEINVSLHEVTKKMDELVVIGYGSEYRKDLTGSVSSISKDQIDRRSVSSPSQLLQGQVAGVQVTKNSGAPGGGSKVRIRGMSSIQAGNDPLYVVDGVPINGGSSPSQDPLSLINPDDIISMEVLKDASATAIYGSRGANGVVLITTNQGGGGTRVNFEAKYGVNSVRKKLDLFNSTQFLDLAKEVADNDGTELRPIYSDPPGSYPDTDWQDELFRRGPQQSYQLSITGGDKNTRYAISGNFKNDKGILLGSDYKRGSFRINFSKDVSDRFTVGNHLIVSRAKYNLDETGGRGLLSVTNRILQIPSIYPVKDENGNYVFKAEGDAARPNPVASAVEKTDISNRFKSVGDLYGKYKITNDLEAKISIGGNLRYRKDKFYAPSSTLQGIQNDGGIGSVTDHYRFHWVNNNTLTYKHEFLGLHKITLLGGFTLEHNKGENLKGEAAGFNTDDFKYNNLSAGEQPSLPITGEQESSLVSYLGRLNYNFDERYLLTLTGRIDGSSRFGSNNRYGFFPAVALAWRISNEAFMQDQDLVSNLKLRLTYGINGNQQIGDYTSYRLLNNVPVNYGTQLARGFYPSNYGNEDLKWEKTTQYNAGVDVGFFDGRISFTGDIYYKKTTDLLLNQPVPSFTGYNNYINNVGSVENRGLELQVSTKNIQGKDFTWNSSLNFAANRNKVLKLAKGKPLRYIGSNVSTFALGGQSFRIIKEGKSIGAMYGYTYGGVYRDQAQINNSPTAVTECPNGKATCSQLAQPGDPYLKDISGPDGTPDGVIDENDQSVIGNFLPDFTFGISNNFFYKGFDLNVFIQGSYGNDIANMNTFRLESARGTFNQTINVLNRWTPENTNTDIPRATQKRDNAFRTAMRSVSTRIIEDGSYLRLKNLTLGYTFPVDWASTLSARSIRLYASALNLFTITRYSGYDPEVSTYNSISRYGADSGTYPQTRTFLMGIQLGF